jgi:type II secretory pathway pseudopilin PulG
MTCPRCGATNLADAVFCSSCATNLRAALPAVPLAAQRTSGLAIAGFVLSFFCSLFGLIFSILGYNECKRSLGTVKGQGLALAGIIISSFMLVVGILAAVAIPAFLSYMSHSRGGAEARMNLRRIERAAIAAYNENGQFPIAHERLTPAIACCDQPNHVCDDSAAWHTPGWLALDVGDPTPHHYQYSYDSDGTTVEATAVGDRTCKGSPLTYRLRITVEAGTPTASITGP